MTRSIDSIVDRQFRSWEMELGIPGRKRPQHSRDELAHPVITVSRQHGSNGSEIATQLAERFQYTLLHRDVIDRLCESTDYSRRLLETLDEHAQSQLTTWVQSMLAGRYVDEGDYARALLRTVYSIARLGGVVVVGRGSNFIVGPERGFHVRVVAPRETRIGALVERKGLSRRDAAREVDVTDQDRARTIRRLFGRSVDDPLAYDVVVNPGDATAPQVAEWLAGAARVKFENLRPLEPAAASAGLLLSRV
jgi:cytidylate kinase